MTSNHPRLRSHTRKTKGGRVTTYYFYDMRHEGKPDIPLGRDYTEALKQWDELHNRKPRIAGTIKEAFERWTEEALPAYTNAGTKRGYLQNIKAMEAFFGPMTWASVTLPILKGYLKKRTAKTQGNRELSVLQIIWNWARTEGLTDLHWPAAGMERSKWKNKEHARPFEVTDAVFAAIYADSDPVLRATLDLATSTGFRLTDCREVLLPPIGSALRHKAKKTGKVVEFDIQASPVLSRLVADRRATPSNHLMLLSTPTGKPVSMTMLRARWDTARAKAAARPENAAIADDLKRMYLRDMRKRAADLAGSVEAASKLLQHSSVGLTGKHYYTKPEKVRPVR